jgi:baculoviral IAP repeat-containing protein 6
MLRRNTTIEIECHVDEEISMNYETNIRDENEVFASQAGLMEHNYYYHHPLDGHDREPLHMKEIMKELSKTLPKELEVNARGSMFVRFDEDNPQYLKAMLTGIEGTPYSSGIFLFDIFLPAEYPYVPCHCIHVTPNASLVKANNGPGGFSPNLHSDTGQVCLSLLGTWDGPRWESGKSNIYQVLSTILYMILGAQHPYYMEPDYGGWEGTAPLNIDDDPEKDLVVEYDEEVKLFNAKLSILAPLKDPPKGFESLARMHLYEKRKVIIATLRRWSRKGSPEFNDQLLSVISEIEEAFKTHITRRYAEQDCKECEQLIQYIEEKMDFLTNKIRKCSLKCFCKQCVATVCSACCEEAKTKIPKAFERFVLGPKLLAQARTNLIKAQQIAKQLPE